jgi:hypothetical protein
VVNGGALGTPSSGTVTNLTGTASININGTVGATTASTGAFTTLTASGVTTITNGTNATSTSSGALQVSGGASVLLDLWVGGNVYTNNVVSTTYTNLSVNDPLLYLSAVNPYPYNYDIGEYSHFVGGPANVYAHTGMVRSYANGYWGLFSNVKSEPAGTVNWNDAGLIWDTFKSGALLLANTTSASSTTSGALQVAGGAGIAGALYAGSAYDNGNRVVTTVNTTAGTGITLSAQTTTGPTTAVTITNSGVTSAVAGTDISISGATGAVTINDTSTLATVTGRGASTSTAVTFSGGITAGTSILPSSNVAVNIGSTSAWFNNIYGTAVHAQYADLAENYQGDRQYNPGTVLMFGGSQEVTVADADTTRVAGVVSTNPATLMNGGLVGPNVVPVAFTGRVPCNVIGPVAKGDLMVSAGFGYAKVNNTPQVGSIIGKALEDFPIAGKGVIEVVVGRF